MSYATQIEVIITKIHQDHISYTTKNVLESSKSPDEEVLDFLMTCELTNYETYISHSTSWRFEKHNKIVLTYLVVIPENEKVNLDRNLTLSKSFIANSGLTYLPSPSNISDSAVVRHAIRHLAYLLKHDYEKKYKKLFNQEQLEYIFTVYDEVAEEVNSIV